MASLSERFATRLATSRGTALPTVRVRCDAEGHTFGHRRLTFATATEADAGFVASVWNDATTLHAQHALPIEALSFAEMFAAEAAAAAEARLSHETFVVRAKGQPVAVPEVYEIKTEAEKTLGVAIGLNVAPAMRGRGVGSACFEALTAFGYRHLAAPHVLAATSLDNISAQRAIKRAGFVEVPGTHPWPRPDGEIVDSLLFLHRAAPALLPCPKWRNLRG